MSIKLQLLPPTSASSSSTPLKIKVLPSTKISALIHTYLVKSKLPLSQKEHLSVWLEDEELELAATVKEEEISPGEKLRIVYKEKRKVHKGKGSMVEPVVEKGKVKGKEQPRREEEEEEEDELDQGPEWDEAFLRELDQKSNPSPAVAPTRPSSSSSSSKHLKPSTSGANNSTTSIVQLATLHPRPKTEYTSTTYLTYTPGSSSKRQKFKPLVPSHLNNPSSSNVASVAQEEEGDEFSSFFPDDDLLASIDLAPPAAVEEPISLPSTPPPLPHAPPNTPDYVPSPETLLALQERLSALPGASPPGRDSHPSRGAAQPHPKKALPPPSPSRRRSPVSPPPAPTKRSSSPPTSSSSSSSAADKLAKFRYVAPPSPPPAEPASPSPQPPAASPKPSPPPQSSHSSPLFNSQPFASSSKPKPTSTNKPPLPRIKDVYGVDSVDDFFSDAVDPRDGYERVKIEEDEGGVGLEEERDVSHEEERERDDLPEEEQEEESSKQQEDMVVDFWGHGGMVKKGEETGPPASFVARRDEGEGEEKGWVYEEEGGGGAGFGFEGDDGDGDGVRVSAGGGVAGFVASLPVVREEEEVDELEGDDGGGTGGEAMEGVREGSGVETLVGREKMPMKAGEGQEDGEKEKRALMPLPPTPESLPRPDRPLSHSTSTDAAPPPRPSFTIASSTPPPSRNLTILNLPSSILHLIFLQTIDPFCLSNLSVLLTSKLFHSIARPILYRVVSLRSTQGWSSFFTSGSSTELRSASGNAARRKEDYDAVEELEIHAEASNVASDLARIDMVLALHDISSKRGRTKNTPFVPNSTPFLPKLKKLTLSFPPTSPTSSLDHTVTLRPFHPALLKALSFPIPTVEITLIGVRKSDQVRAVFGTVQGVQKVVLERPVEGGRRELCEMARTSGGRIEVPMGDEGWVPVERVEEWRKKSVWVGML